MTEGANLFPVTFFRNFAAASKSEARHTLGSLARLITTRTAPHKDALPWLKLARFGMQRTVNASLRHDANVLVISGIEADYDGGQMPFDDAVALLAKQGIASICYTSPSHSEAVPRWRVLCPLSEVMLPARRSHLMGRLNGLFGGIFAGESWTLSQSYYFGAINRNRSHRVEIIDGHPIDLHDDLDVIWRDKPGASATAADGQTAGREVREDAELIRCVVTGEHFHVELVALAARYIGRGIPAATVVELLRGIMLSHPEGARDDRWLDRYCDLERTVASAVGKYKGDGAAVRNAAAPDPRRKDTARAAFTLLRKGAASDELLTVLHRLNGQRPDPLPAEVVNDTARWAARQAGARKHAG
jgi:hypothetical protein